MPKLSGLSSRARQPIERKAGLQNVLNRHVHPRCLAHVHVPHPSHKNQAPSGCPPVKADSHTPPIKTNHDRVCDHHHSACHPNETLPPSMPYVFDGRTNGQDQFAETNTASASRCKLARRTPTTQVFPGAVSRTGANVQQQFIGSSRPSWEACTCPAGTCIEGCSAHPCA